MKIVCLDAYTVYPAADEVWRRFRQLGEVTVYDRTAPDELVARIADADAVLTNKVPLDAAVFAACPSLKYVGVLATGYNIVDTSAAADAGVAVTNIPAYSTMSVAQHVFSLLFAATAGVHRYAAEVRDGAWSRCPDFSYRDSEWPELAGMTMGIVGFGNIGGAVAAIASALGMKVALYTSKNQEDLPVGYQKMDLGELFAKADVISLHCPLTPSTRALVNAERLAMMKSSAILINTSRGPVVDEQALAEALREGRIAAACLDVLSQEPPSASNPLLSAPNCFITPHIAWASSQARKRLFDIAYDNLRAFAEGRPQNVVN